MNFTTMDEPTTEPEDFQLATIKNKLVTYLDCSEVPPFHDFQIIDMDPCIIVCGRNNPDLGRKDISFADCRVMLKHFTYSHGASLESFENSQLEVAKEITTEFEEIWEMNRARPLTIKLSVFDDVPHRKCNPERTIAYRLAVILRSEPENLPVTELVLPPSLKQKGFLLRGFDFKQAQKDFLNRWGYFNILKQRIYPHDADVQDIFLIDSFTNGNCYAAPEEFENCVASAYKFFLRVRKDFTLLFWIEEIPKSQFGANEPDFVRTFKKTICNETIDVESFYTRNKNGNPVLLSYTYIYFNDKI